MSTVLQNGRQQPHPQQRKQLSDQLDRFDQILDGLAEGLNGAMADAAREGTRLAVKDAIVEILTNPDLRAAIQGTGPVPVTAEPAPPPAPTSAWAKVKDLLRRARAALAGAVRAARSFVVRKVSAVAAVAVGAGKVTLAAWRVKKAVLGDRGRRRGGRHRGVLRRPARRCRPQCRRRGVRRRRRPHRRLGPVCPPAVPAGVVRDVKV